MSLLGNYSGKQLKEMAEQKLVAGASEELMRELFGPRPYYWEQMVAPPYGKFKPQWRDASGREYSELPDDYMAMRLPIAKNRDHSLTFPAIGEKLFLVEVGGGNTIELEVLTAGARRATGWFQYKRL